MKKYIPYLSILAVALSSGAVQAQDFDNKPLVTVEKKSEDLKFTVGARFMADAAYYGTDYTPMKSGAAIVDSRIRTSLTYKDWYFYADFDFSGGKFTQKNIFMQYTFPTETDAHHIIKAGYYNDPFGMARNTSLGSYHFISRPGPANALAPGRELGVSYKFYNNQFFANQGVFTENQYNDQIAGVQGLAVGGRWLWRPVNDEFNTFHIGASFRYGKIMTGSEYKEGLGVIQTQDKLGTAMETYVDKTQFVTATLPWANNTINAGAELLYVNPKFFARGEYNFKSICKRRDNRKIFLSELRQNPNSSWMTQAAWEGANPLRTNQFHGGYVEAGYQILGNGYKYSNADGLVGGLNGRALEVVARYSYTGLNDIVDGELYVPGRDQYYPGGQIKDYPYKSTSVGGGNMHAVTVGVNYAFNRFAQVMLDYTYSNLDRDFYVYDQDFHTVQARVMFTF